RAGHAHRRHHPQRRHGGHGGSRHPFFRWPRASPAAQCHARPGEQPELVMLSNLDRKLLRDLNRMKGQVVAVALVMACGLAMLVMARSLIYSLESTRQEYYEAQRFAEVFARLKRAPNSLVSRLAEIPGVAA